MISKKQLIISLTTGIVFWFIFAIAINYTPMLFTGGMGNVILFAVTFPMAWYLFIPLLEKLADLNTESILPSMVMAFAIAMLFDGVVFTWFPEIYGQTPLHVRAGAGYILWGAGVTLGLTAIKGRTIAL